MNRLTLGSSTNPRSFRSDLARMTGVCASDPRILRWASEAQERLLPKGRWLGSVQRYRVCINESCITMPRQIETVETWWLCSTPMQIRDQWYETLESGPGLQSADCGSPRLIDRGTACSFREISGLSSKINVIASVAEATGSRILLQGYDENSQWIRTQDAGAWIDGEYVTLVGPGTRSTNTFTALTGVIKPQTNGPVALYEWPLALAGNLHQLASYENDETHPHYRRYLIPGLADVGACEGSQDPCDSKSVTFTAKLRHMDILGDNDWFVLGNKAALKWMVRAIVAEDEKRFDLSLQYEANAIRELEMELGSYEGDGVIPVLRVAHPSLFGGGSIENVISVPLA